MASRMMFSPMVFEVSPAARMQSDGEHLQYYGAECSERREEGQDVGRDRQDQPEAAREIDKPNEFNEAR